MAPLAASSLYGERQLVCARESAKGTEELVRGHEAIFG